jgi:YD repeat-containing protein
MPPGTQIELWYFDEAPDGSRPNAWAQYGTGTVTPDGGQVVPDTDPSTGKPYGQPRFCCGADYLAKKKAEADAANSNRGGSSTGAAGTGAKAGEPVDLSTGIFILQNTDLAVPGRVPLALTRTYRSNGASGGPFGPGTSHPYHILLLVESNLRTLLLPNGARVAFPQQTDGTFRNHTDPSMRGAVLTETSGLATVRWKDGSLWTFGTPAYGIAYLSGQRDRTGNALAITRDSLQNVTAITDAMGRQLSMTVDANNHITAITDPLGRSVQYAYDASGRL